MFKIYIWKKCNADENVNAAKRNAGGTRETSNMTEIGKVNPYLGMELGLNKGNVEGFHFAGIKKIAVDEDGTTIRKTY